jgi:hypothetical protein
MTLSESDRKKLREGISTFKGGDRRAAHTIFLHLLEKYPEDVTILVYAAGTAPTRAEAITYLERAQTLKPDSSAIKKVYVYIQNLPEEPEPEVAHHGAVESRWLGRVRRQIAIASPPWWKIALGTAGGALVIAVSMLLLVLAYFVYLNILVPRQVTAQVKSLQSTVVTDPLAYAISTTAVSPSLDISTAPSIALSPSVTVTLTPTASPSATATLPSPEPSLEYAPVSFMEYYQDPGKYVAKPLAISGQVVGFGEALVNGELVFSIQLGMNPGEALADTAISPLLILNIAPDPNLQINDLVIISGLGAQAAEEILIHGVHWDGPIFQGSSLKFINP